MEALRELKQKIEAGELTEEEMEIFMNVLKNTSLTKGHHIEESSKTEAEDKSAKSKADIEKLALKSTEFYEEKLGINPDDFIFSRKTYETLGQFDYGDTDYTEDIEEWSGVYGHTLLLYYGQIKPGTELKDGIGIRVCKHGTTIVL